MLLGDSHDVRVRRDRRRAAGEGRPEREERHERDPALGAEPEDVLAVALHDAERVLYAHELYDLERLLDRRAVRAADPDPLDLALAAQVPHRAELLGERDLAVAVHQAQVYRGERVDPERSKVRLDSRAQLLGTLRRQPGARTVASAADPGDDPQVRGIRVQRRADQIVDDVRAVVLRGVDVV